MQHEEVGVQDQVAAVLVAQQVGAVLGDAGADQVELAPLRPEPAEVADGGGVPEEALDLVDVEPGRHAALEVRVHAVAHRFQHRDDAEGAHVVGQVFEPHAGDAPVEGDVALVVEDGEGPGDVSLEPQRDDLGLGLRLLPQDVVKVLQLRDGSALAAGQVRLLHAAADDRALDVREALVALRHGRGGQR